MEKQVPEWIVELLPLFKAIYIFLGIIVGWKLYNWIQKIKKENNENKH